MDNGRLSVSTMNAHELTSKHDRFLGCTAWKRYYTPTSKRARKSESNHIGLLFICAQPISSMNTPCFRHSNGRIAFGVSSLTWRRDVEKSLYRHCWELPLQLSDVDVCVGNNMRISSILRPTQHQGSLTRKERKYGNLCAICKEATTRIWRSNTCMEEDDAPTWPHISCFNQGFHRFKFELFEASHKSTPSGNWTSHSMHSWWTPFAIFCSMLNGFLHKWNFSMECHHTGSERLLRVFCNPGMCCYCSPLFGDRLTRACHDLETQAQQPDW